MGILIECNLSEFITVTLKEILIYFKGTAWHSVVMYLTLVQTQQSQLIFQRRFDIVDFSTLFRRSIKTVEILTSIRRLIDGECRNCDFESKLNRRSILRFSTLLRRRNFEVDSTSKLHAGKGPQFNPSRAQKLLSITA